MKKLLFIIVALSFILLGACSSEGDSTEKNNNTTSSQDNESTEGKDVTETESEYPFPENAEPVGDASIVVSTPAGDSSDGNAPVLFVNEDDLLIQIGLDAENFQGDKETFVYINEKFFITEQFGEMNSTSLDLQGDLLKPGEYTVTAVQYEENDPAKAPVNITEAKYKVEKSS
jgi:hypothetical protein